MQCAARNEVAQIRLMVHCGLDPGGTGVGGATPLHIAAWHGHGEMVDLLLGFHAPVNALDVTFGSSPLSWAIHGSTLNKAFLFSHPDAPKKYPPIMHALREAGGEENPRRPYVS